MINNLRPGGFTCLIVWALMCGVLSVGLSSGVSAGGRLINAPSSSDMVYDEVDGILYITNGDSVLRYSTTFESFLPPFQIGGNLRGIDLSPDRSTLAVADLTYGGDSWTTTGGTAWFHLVDTQTGDTTKVTFDRGYGDGGTYSIAFGSDGNLLFTSTFLGSGWVPLYHYDTATEEITTLIYSIRMDSMLSASADRSVIAWEESNTSDGPFGRYRVSDGDLIHRTGYDYGTSAFNYSVAANRNGTQYAVLYGGAAICDAQMIKTGKILSDSAGSPGNAVYDPVRDILYFSWVNTTKVRAYDTSTLSMVWEYDMGGTFTRGAYGVGRLRTAQDGSLLFAIIPTGISYVRLDNNPPTADPQSVITDEDVPVNITLSGADADGDDITYSIPSYPAHGTLTGTAPNLVYTPAANYNGTDSFTFRVSDLDTDSLPATVSIAVNPVEDLPVATPASTTVVEESVVSITLSGYDPDTGGALTYTVVNGPAHGSLSGAPPHVSYRPDFDYSGPDTFTFKVNNGLSDSIPARVSITVIPGRPHQTCSIGAAKKVPSGTYVLIEDAVVTAPNLEPGVSFISSSMRSAGIKVLATTNWQVGERVRLKGYVDRVDGEYQLSTCTLGPVETGKPLGPLFMVTSTVANDFWENLDYTGINTTGLLVRLCGKVTAVIPSQSVIYINDGVDRPAVIGPFNGVRVKFPAGMTLPAKGRRIVVTGVSRPSAQTVVQWVERDNVWYPPGLTVYVPEIQLRNTADVWTP